MTQESIEKLAESFIVPGSKTLKIEPKTEQTLEHCVRTAYDYLEQWPFHTRVEFRYNRMYIVVARLKE